MERQTPTIEQLLTVITAFPQLFERVENIERMLLKIASPQPEADRWFDLPELCEYLPEKPAKATVYSWVNAYAIPFFKKGKKLYFSKKSIDSWLQEGRRKTVKELTAEAENRLIESNK